VTLRQALFRAAVASVVVLAAAPAVGPAPAASAAPSAKGAHIAVIGDSYTAGSDEGGGGTRSWPTLAWKLLAQRGLAVDANVAAEGGAGYGQRGSAGRVFEDLTAQAVQRDDALVVFFGSRNDQPVDPKRFPSLAASTFKLARFTAPDAKFLIIGPPWPTATPPPEVLKIRDSLRAVAAAGPAQFVDPIAEGWFVDRPELIGADGVHPTDAGHRYMAERIAPLIYSQLTIRV
jgi:lysophospholipase L1-like esterase